jgi:erythronate-4-phosphate dehydrogenase
MPTSVTDWHARARSLAIQSQAYIDGRYVPAASGKMFDCVSPIDGRLLARVDIGTPHIAGYSLEGKLNGTAMVYRAACTFLGVEPTWNPEAAVPPRPAGLPLQGFGGGDTSLAHLDRKGLAALAETVTASCAILRDDEALRKTVGMSAAERGKAFDLLRKTYPVRREFS